MMDAAPQNPRTDRLTLPLPHRTLTAARGHYASDCFRALRLSRRVRDGQQTFDEAGLLLAVLL